jgi:hypothetical protein
MYRLKEEPTEIWQLTTACIIPLALSTAAVTQTNHTAVPKHSIPALLYIFRCRKQKYLMHAVESESFWQNSE